MFKYPGCQNIFQECDFKEDRLQLFFLAILQEITARSYFKLVYFYISKQEINFHEKMSVNKTSQARNSGNAFL